MIAAAFVGRMGGGRDEEGRWASERDGKSVKAYLAKVFYKVYRIMKVDWSGARTVFRSPADGPASLVNTTARTC